RCRGGRRGGTTSHLPSDLLAERGTGDRCECDLHVPLGVGRLALPGAVAAARQRHARGSDGERVRRPARQSPADGDDGRRGPLRSPAHRVLRLRAALHRSRDRDDRDQGMKITEVRPLVLGAAWRNLTFVVVRTDEGIEGVGEVRMINHTDALLGYLAEATPNHVLGADPFEIEDLVGRMMRNDYARAGQIAMSGIACIETACWD